MNHSETLHRTASREATESRFARRIAACLTEGAQAVPAGVGERLRFSREQALERAQRARSGDTARHVGSAGGTATLGLSSSPWWLRIASVLPLVALVGGLVLIQDRQARTQISVAAESTRRCWATICPSRLTATLASPNS